MSIKELDSILKQLLKDRFPVAISDQVLKYAWRSGKPLEWLLILVITSEFESLGFESTFGFNKMHLPQDYLFNNQIPRSYKSLAGKVSIAKGENGYERQFLASLIPKVEFARGNEFFSIFKEGNPLSEIINQQSMMVRPDISVLNVRSATDYPKVDEQGMIRFKFENQTGYMMGTLEPVIGSFFPLLDLEISSRFTVRPVLVVESTMSKNKVRAVSQIAEYSKVLKMDTENIFILTVKKIIDLSLENQVIIHPKNLHEELSRLIKFAIVEK